MWYTQLSVSLSVCSQDELPYRLHVSIITYHQHIIIIIGTTASYEPRPSSEASASFLVIVQLDAHILFNVFIYL